MKLIPWYRRAFAREFMDLINWNIEHAYKHKVVKKVSDTLDATHLIPKTPHDMNEIMKNTRNIL